MVLFFSFFKKCHTQDESGIAIKASFDVSGLSFYASRQVEFAVKRLYVHTSWPLWLFIAAV